MKNHLIETLIIIIFLTGAYLFLDRYTTLFNDSKNTIEVEVPDNTDVQLPTASTTNPIVPLNLLTGKYIPNSDVFSNSDAFLNDSIDVGLIGNFSEAELVIGGNITNDLRNFISINIDYESGTFGVERSNNNRIIYDQNKTGVFTKNKPINITIDLLSPVKLATTKKEREQGAASFKTPILWNKIQPPPTLGSVAKILVVPYDEMGTPGSEIVQAKWRKFLPNIGIFIQLPLFSFKTVCLYESLETLKIEWFRIEIKIYKWEFDFNWYWKPVN